MSEDESEKKKVTWNSPGVIVPIASSLLGGIALIISSVIGGLALYYSGSLESREKLLENRELFFTAKEAELTTKIADIEVTRQHYTELLVGLDNREQQLQTKVHEFERQIEESLRKRTAQERLRGIGINEHPIENGKGHAVHFASLTNDDDTDEIVGFLAEIDKLSYIDLGESGISLPELVQALPETTRERIQHLVYTTKGVENEWYSLGLLTNLKSLRLAINRDCSVSGLNSALQRLNQLESLSIHTEQNLDLGIGSFSRLKHIAVSGQVSDALLTQISSIRDLQTVLSPGVTNRDFVRMLSSRQLLRRVDLTGLSGTISSEDFSIFASGTQLSELSLANCSIEKGSIAVNIQTLNKLTWLDVSYCDLNDQDWAAIGSLSSLQTLIAQGTKLDANAVKGVGQSKSLQNLVINDAQIANKAISYLQNHRTLKRLFCARLRSEIPINDIPICPHLEELDLSGTTSINSVIIASIEKQPSLRRLYWGSASIFDGQLVSRLRALDRIELIALPNLTWSKDAREAFERSTDLKIPKFDFQAWGPYDFKLVCPSDTHHVEQLNRTLWKPTSTAPTMQHILSEREITSAFPR